MQRIQAIARNAGTPLTKAYSSNSAATAFTVPTASATRPSGEGVVDFATRPPRWIKVIPFGTGSDNQTFDVRVIGWSLVGSTWIPVILCQFSATLSAFVGLSGADVTDSDRFADTISTPAIGEAGVTCQAYSPANDTPGQMLIDAAGCTVFRIDIDRTGSSTGNALVGEA